MTRFTTVLLVAAIVILGGAAPGPVSAQEAETTDFEPIGGLPFVGEFELTIVNVIVNVTDRDGRPVTDLGADDFRVFQDGEERQITNFQLYTEDLYRQQDTSPPSVPVPEPQPATSATDTERPEPRPVWVVMYIDHQNLHPLDRNRVLKQLRDFVRDNLRPSVQMMVVSRHRRAQVVQDFTSDASLVLQAMRSVQRDTGGRSERDSERSDILQLMQSAQDRGVPGDNSPSRANALITSFAEEDVNELSFTISDLRGIVSMLSGLPGKKALLYLSNGLPMVGGQELFYAYANAYDEPSAVTSSTRYDQSRLFRSLTALANAQDVTFYPVDATGLDVAALGTVEYAQPHDTIAASIGRQNYQNSLRFMAEATGGIAITNTNDVSVHLDKLEGDFFTYYSLGYPLSRSGGDKVHEIKVELTDPDHDRYTVRYRRRFVEKSIETQLRDKVQTGLVFDLADNPMELTVDTDRAAPASQDRWSVPIKVRFPIDKVALLPEGDAYVGRVVMYVAARDLDGKQSDVVRQDYEVRVPTEDLERARSQLYSISTTLLMEGGSHTISIGLMDQVTRQSSFVSSNTMVGS